ncbi:MAG: ABC transporter permease subunit, partial [Aquiluna sp.]
IQSRLRIALPLQAPALAAATLLVSLYSATSYGLVITLGQGGIETLETQIAQSALQELDLQRAGLLALIQTLMTLSFFLIARRLGAKPTVLFGEEQVSADGSKIGAGLGLLLIASAGFVFWSVLSRALFEGEGLLGNLANLSGRGTRDILNLSVTDALGNSVRNLVISASLALAISWLLSKRRAGSWLLLPLVQTIFLIPLAYQIIAPARASLSSEMLEAAELDGASGIRLFGLIELPTLARPIGAAAALVGLGSLGEFGAASFLAYGSDATLPLVMFRLLSRPGTENLGMAMTAASLLILLAFLVVWVISSVQTERQRP